jgi:hypothetical protein
VAHLAEEIQFANGLVRSRRGGQDVLVVAYGEGDCAAATASYGTAAVLAQLGLSP